MSRILPALACALTLAACGGTADFARIDADLRAAGKLRADRTPRDAPYDRADLVETFGRIAFGSEFAIRAGRYAPLDPDAAAPLTRWTRPVRYALLGAHGPADAAAVAALTERLSRATGIAFSPAEREPNMMIFFLDADARESLSERFAETPDYQPLLDLYEAWADDPVWPCAAEFYYRPPHHPRAFEIYFAVVYIRDEVRGISRRSCIEEEIAQSMGLARDDPAARPSIFNDDEEFALMTAHDADLLGLLYDPRLEPGMTAAEALPVARRILGLTGEE